MRVIGTAGHVDHGKSTLIAALTGVHPDRLKEEKEREMTIDLGFGWLSMPDGEEIGIVDVPGHRDFIENMLAGIGGIDAALLIIAADEGVMPQTREHLAILDLLQIPSGIVVMTKIDMVDDPDWLDLVEMDIRTTLDNTIFAEAPLVRVSAKTRQGLDALKKTLHQLLQEKPDRLDLGRPRLPIDRVFSMPGFGTIVTGTLADGSLSLGDEVVILPAGVKGRIRGLQTHKKKEDSTTPGSRTAVNISGVSIDQIRRGEVVTRPSQYQATRRIDAQFRLLDDVSLPLKHNTEVKFFSGASETIATLRLLGTESLAPGEQGWIQLELREPVVVVRGDHYILRRPSPSETLGGGLVIDPQPKGRHRRFNEKIIKALQAMSQGSPSDLLLQASLALGAAPLRDVVVRSRLEKTPAEQAVLALLANGQWLLLEDETAHPEADLLVMAAAQWADLQNRTRQMIAGYHQQFPLRAGMPREELKSRLKITPRLFNALIKNLVKTEYLLESGKTVKQPGHEIRLNDGQQAKVRELMRQFIQNPFSPPSTKESIAVVGDDLFNALLETEKLVAVSPDVVFRKEDYEKMTGMVTTHIKQHGQISVAEARDLFNSSRKYILGLLEHFDAIGLTFRDGDFRKLRGRR